MATAAQAAAMTHMGANQTVFAERLKAKFQELMETGQSKPFTIINWNPVGLYLEGELNRYRVPSPDDARLPKGVSRVSLMWDGKERCGHALTIREPHMYGRMVNATAKDGDLAQAIPEREVAYYLPVAVSYAFLEHFSPIFVTKGDKMATPPPKDARRIFGVLAFEGDLHTFESQYMRLKEERAAGGGDPNRPVTERPHIRVPLARVLQIGKTSTRIYESVAYPLEDYLREMFAGQLNYGKVSLARAQQKWNETQTVKDISESDRVWWRFFERLGYVQRPKQGEKHWVNEVLDVTGLLTSGDTAETVTLRKCESCRTPEPEAGTPFCAKCGNPIDTYETFMAGFPVAEALLQARMSRMTPEQRAEIEAELARRAKPVAAASKPAKEQLSKPANSRQRTANSKQPPADDAATELPGE